MNIQQAIRNFNFEMSVNELKLMKRDTKNNSLTYNSLLYLDIISYRPDCTVSFLAEKLQISKSAVTVKVNELIGLGLVQKTQSQTDKRVYHLQVSETVCEEYRFFQQSLDRAVEKMEKTYSAEALSSFGEMLALLSEEYRSTIPNE